MESNKRKVSYAASISLPYIPKGTESKVEKALLDFDAISVREKNDKEMLEKILDRSIDWVVDPTMLLPQKEWKKLCVYNKYAGKNYIFAYFLGGNIRVRKWVKKFAKKKELQVVTIPYLLDTFRISDVGFGDIRLSSVSPELWLTLIKDAKYVFTDSFHGTVFSLLFHKQFFTFCRESDKSKSSGNSRIYSLFELFSITDRLINVSNDVTTLLDNTSSIDYEYVDLVIERERDRSFSFLKNGIEN